MKGEGRKVQRNGEQWQPKQGKVIEAMVRDKEKDNELQKLPNHHRPKLNTYVCLLQTTVIFNL